MKTARTGKVPLPPSIPESTVTWQGSKNHSFPFLKYRALIFYQYFLAMVPRVVLWELDFLQLFFLKLRVDMEPCQSLALGPWLSTFFGAEVLRSDAGSRRPGDSGTPEPVRVRNWTTKGRMVASETVASRNPGICGHMLPV